MKKWIALTLVFILTFVLAGCKTEEGSVDDPSRINATSIDITGYIADIEIDDEVQLSATVNPSGASQEIIWSSRDTSILTVDQNGLVKGIGPGTAEIVATAKSNSRIFRAVNITVTTPIVIEDPSGVEVSGSNQVTINSFITLTATVSPQGALQEVTWESSDENIATVNSNGRVTGKAEGNVTITVRVVAEASLYATHAVSVNELDLGPIVEDPTDIIINGEEIMYDGTNLNLIATVLPSGVSQSVTWTSVNPTIATVSAGGQVTALREGTVFIIATSVVNPDIQKTHKIIVRAAPVIEPYPDMQGYTIRIMAASHAKHEHDPFDPGYTHADVNAKQSAWREVETNFNCKIVVVDFPDEAPWGAARFNWMIQQAELNAATADIYVSATDWIKILVDGNAIIDTKDFYDSFGQNSMGAALRLASTYRGGLFSLPTTGGADLQVDRGLFYNVALIERLGLESPAKLFNEGNWTYTRFQQYVNDATPLLGEEQTVLSGKPALYWIGMTNAAGVRLADTISMDTNFRNTYAIQSASILRNLYLSSGWGTNAWDADATSFNEGNSIFQAGSLWFVRTGNRWPGNMWGDNSRYGYVPFPHPDNVSKENTRTAYSGGAVYNMANGVVYPAGVTSRDVYRAFTEMMLNTTKYLLEDPTYSGDGIMTIAAQNRTDDPESVNALVFFKPDKVVFDPLYGMLSIVTFVGPALDRIVIEGADYHENMDVERTRYVTRLLELYG